jgi:hypothetical protein
MDYTEVQRSIMALVRQLAMIDQSATEIYRSAAETDHAYKQMAATTRIRLLGDAAKAGEKKPTDPTLDAHIEIACGRLSLNRDLAEAAAKAHKDRFNSLTAQLNALQSILAGHREEMKRLQFQA